MDTETNKLKSGSMVMINLLCCVVLFCLPIILSSRYDTFSWLRYWNSCVMVFGHLLIFYLNFLWLIDRFLFRSRWAWFFTINAVVIAITAVGLNLWHVWYYTDVLISSNRPAPVFDLLRTIRDALFMIPTAALAVAVKTTNRWQRAEREKAQMEAVVSQAELKNLKSQLNPHFLFNTLNNIYSLMEIDHEKAQDAILGLSKILRYVLYDDNQQRVPLGKELSFTRSYIELMSLRLTQRVHLTTHIEEHTEGLSIAPLMFISLVENAFKHGVSQVDESYIDISIDLNGRTVECVVKNSLFPKKQGDYSGSGIGVENLRRRLELLYPERHRFTVRTLSRVYIAELFIDLD